MIMREGGHQCNYVTCITDTKHCPDVHLEHGERKGDEGEVLNSFLPITDV